MPPSPDVDFKVMVKPSYFSDVKRRQRARYSHPSPPGTGDEFKPAAEHGEVSSLRNPLEFGTAKGATSGKTCRTAHGFWTEHYRKKEEGETPAMMTAMILRDGVLLDETLNGPPADETCN